MKRLGIILMLTLSACENSSSVNGINLGPLITGTFASECFHNRGASSPGNDVYTTATFTLNANGTGNNYVQLFSDAACATPNLFEANFSINFSYEKNYADVFVMHVNQNVEGETQSFYITGVVQNDGYYFDIDLTKNPNCGPFDTLPVEGDTTFFAADPENVGVRLDRI